MGRLGKLQVGNSGRSGPFLFCIWMSHAFLVRVIGCFAAEAADYTRDEENQKERTLRRYYKWINDPTDGGGTMVGRPMRGAVDRCRADTSGPLRHREAYRG